MDHVDCNKSAVSTSAFLKRFINGYGFTISRKELNPTQQNEEEIKLRKLGFKECPVCINKLCSAQLLLAHLSFKHPEVKNFQCNICLKKSIKGGEKFLLHLEKCHSGSNITFQESIKLPYIKSASVEEGRDICGQIGILYCETHGVCFRTNEAAHAHRKSRRAIPRPCYFIYMKGTIGSSEWIELPEETEAYMKTRAGGRSERVKRKLIKESSEAITTKNAKSQSNPTEKPMIGSNDWNKYPRSDNWENQIRQENLIQPIVGFSATENFSNLYDPLYTNSQNITHSMSYYQC